MHLDYAISADHDSILSSDIQSNKFGLPTRTVEERVLLKQKLPELLWIERIIRNFSDAFDNRVVSSINYKGIQFPIYQLQLGSSDLNSPVLLLTGGVHGVERIGTQVILAWLETTLTQLEWDEELARKLNNVKVILLPIVNPTGMFDNSRCNYRGVDLNRNGPLDAEGKTPWLAGGQRLSKRIAWYRGKQGEMEIENQCLHQILKHEVFNHPLGLVLDLHSGFGIQDRLWIPYAFRNEPIGNIEDYVALKLLWERTYKHHNYLFEPQSLHYLSSGDIWDFFCIESKNKSNCKFIPLTLEMGSWTWVKKRPQQLFSFSGLFHPKIPHRHSRVLRRHLVLLDFLISASINHKNWIPTEKQTTLLKQAAKSLWYNQ